MALLPPIPEEQALALGREKGANLLSCCPPWRALRVRMQADSAYFIVSLFVSLFVRFVFHSKEISAGGANGQQNMRAKISAQ